MNTQNLYFVVLFVVVLILCVLIFRRRYQTEQERRDNYPELFMYIFVGFVFIVLLVLITKQTNTQEYGVRSWVKNWWDEDSAVDKRGPKLDFKDVSKQ